MKSVADYSGFERFGADAKAVRRCFFILALLFVACPFAVFPPAYNPYQFKTTVFLLGISLLFTAAALFLPKAFLTSAKRSPLGIPVAMFAAVVLVSFAFARNHYLAAKEGLLFIGFPVMFYASLAFLRDPRLIRRLMAASVVAAAGMAAIAVLQYVNLVPYWYIDWGQRVAGLFDDPNSLGGYLVWNVIFAIVLTMTAEKRTAKIFWSTANALIAVGLMMSNSRSSWLAALAAFVVLFGSVLIAREGRIRSFFAAFSVVLLVGVAFAAFTFAYKPHGADVVERVGSYKKFAGTEGKPRMIMWRSGAEMAVANPLLGVGIGNLKTELPQYAEVLLDPTEKENEVIYVNHVYNDYIQIAAEMGFPGLFSLLIIIYVLFGAARKGLSKSSSLIGDEKMILGALAAASAGIFVRAGAFQSVVYSPMEWYPLAVFAAGISNICAPPDFAGVRRAGSVNLPRVALSLLGLLLMVVTVWICVPQEISDALYLKSCLAKHKGDISGAAEYARRAYMTTPRDEEMISYYAFTLTLEGDTGKALEYYKKAVPLQPNFYPQYIHIADIYYQKGNYAEALDYYNKALSLLPNNKNAMETAAMCLMLLGRYPDAIKAYSRLAGFYPDEYEHRMYLGICYRKIGRYGDAEKNLEIAMKMEPGSQPVRYNLAATLMMLGRLQEAAGTLVPVIREDPHYADGYVLMSLINYKRGDIGGAEKNLRNYLAEKGGSLDTVLKEQGAAKITADNFMTVYKAAMQN